MPSLPCSVRVAVAHTKSDRKAAALLAEQLRETGDPGMADEADALVIAVREWNADSADEYGVETRRELILASLDTLERFLAGQ
jgi:hypothetical protein